MPTDSKPTIKDRLYAVSSQKRLPLTGAFELSPICNFSCRMCYVRRDAAQVKALGGLKPLEFWLDLARQAKEAGTVFPLLTGGETFLYPHIKELYIAMCHMGMQVSINSNGSCITEEIVQWLKENPPERINITLYGGSNAGYARLCGDPHGFDKMRRGVELLRDNGIRFRFNCSLTPDNCEEFEQMLDFAHEFGQGLKVAAYMFPPVRRTGQHGNYAERFTPKEAAYYQALADFRQLTPERFIPLAVNAQTYRELTPEVLAAMDTGKERTMGCLAGRCSYWVDWQGNLSGCGMMDRPAIPLSEHTFAQAWQMVTDYTNAFRYRAPCADCVNRQVCHSCAAMIFNETGGFTERPVYICEMRRYMAQYYAQFIAQLSPELQAQAKQYAEVLSQRVGRTDLEMDLCAVDPT